MIPPVHLLFLLPLRWWNSPSEIKIFEYLPLGFVTFVISSLQDAGLVKREDLPKDCFIVYQGASLFWFCHIYNL